MIRSPARFTFWWWRDRALELVVALVMAFFVIQISGLVSARQKELLPAGAWFKVNEIFVPDHEVGTDTKMIYDRVINEPFTGFWIVEVQAVREDGLFVQVCSGHGQSHYSTDEIVDRNEVSWKWFIGRDCTVPPGRYRLSVSFVMRQPGWPEKSLSVVSNIFNVVPMGQLGDMSQPRIWQKTP